MASTQPRNNGVTSAIWILRTDTALMYGCPGSILSLRLAATITFVS